MTEGFEDAQDGVVDSLPSASTPAQAQAHALGFAIGFGKLGDDSSSSDSDDASGGDSGGSTGGSGGFGCFPGTELVETPTGTIPISQVKIGDVVYSFDERKKMKVESIVGEIKVHNGELDDWHNFELHPLIRVTYSYAGEHHSMVVTDNHLVYSPHKNKYYPIQDFKVGDEISVYDGVISVGKISKKEVLINSNKNKLPVYNLHMKSGSPNYFVEGVLVHNIK